ncbi:MAG: phosphoribosylanthranilate isomerase [Bacteroidia bacterium]
MKLKVCGLNNRENIMEILKCNPDYIGFIFYAKSPRFIGSLSPDFIRNISSVHKVGVFVNETKEKVFDVVDQYGLDHVQLHGNETPEFCALINEKVPVIKAFQVNDEFDFDGVRLYNNASEYFLFDSKSENYGGSGRPFNHAKLEEYKLNKKIFLSGGIDLNITDDMLYLQSAYRAVFAVDVNSRIEDSPGIKNINKLKVLTDKIRKNEIYG